MKPFGEQLGLGLRYSFARNLFRVGPEAATFTGLMAGSATISVSDASTVLQNANIKNRVRFENLGPGMRYGFARNMFRPGPEASTAPLTGSMSFTISTGGALGAALTGSTSISTTTAGGLITNLMRGASVLRFTTSGDFATATVDLDASGAVSFGGTASLIDANAGVSAITGSTTISFSDPATVLTNFQFDGSGAIAFAGTGDLGGSLGRLRSVEEIGFFTSGSLTDISIPVVPGSGIGVVLGRGFRRWGWPVAAMLTVPPTSTTSLGAITGSTTITFAQGSIELDNQADIEGSTTITFGSSSTLDNVGGPGTVEITGSTSIAFTDPSTVMIGVNGIEGDTIVRFTTFGAANGRTRLVSSEEIEFTSAAFLRANAAIEGSTNISFDVSATYLDNIGVNLITGSTNITFDMSAAGDIRYISWQEETDKSGGWTKESEKAPGWTKESSDSGSWMKEAV